MMAAIVPPTAGDAESVSLQWDALKVPECVLARDGHACVGVPDGGSLVFGGTVVQVLASGQSGKAVETAEVVYIQPLTSPAEDGTLGVNVNTTGTPPCARVSAAACAVDVGGEPSMLVFGGMSMEIGWLGDVHALGMSTLVWKKLELTGELPSPRDKLGAAAVGGKVYFFGGFGPIDAVPDEGQGDAAPEREAANFTWFGDLYELDTATLVCRRLCPIGVGPSARAAHAMCAVGTNVVVCGGKDRSGRRNDVFIYDTVSNEWSSVGMKGAPSETSFAACAPLCDGRVVLFGGRLKDDSHSDATSVLDVVARRWLRVELEGSPPPGRGGHSLCYSGGRVLLYGGASDFHAEAGACLTRHGDLYMLTVIDGAVHKRKQDAEAPESETKTTKV